MRLLGPVSAWNFNRFARYLATRLTVAGHAVDQVQDVSTQSGAQLRRSGRRIVVVTLVAVLVGLLLVLFAPRFRRTAVRDSNREFFPHLNGPPTGEDGS